MTRLLRGLLPVLAASATVAVTALPATATETAARPVTVRRPVSAAKPASIMRPAAIAHPASAARPVTAASLSASRAGQWWLTGLHLPAATGGAGARHCRMVNQPEPTPAEPGLEGFKTQG